MPVMRRNVFKDFTPEAVTPILEEIRKNKKELPYDKLVEEEEETIQLPEEILPFGKHKGLHVSNIPVSYISWALQSAWVHESYGSLPLYTALQKEFIRRAVESPCPRCGGVVFCADLFSDMYTFKCRACDEEFLINYSKKHM